MDIIVLIILGLLLGLFFSFLIFASSKDDFKNMNNKRESVKRVKQKSKNEMIEDMLKNINQKTNKRKKILKKSEQFLQDILKDNDIDF